MKIRAAVIQDSAGIARVQVDSYRTAYAGIFPQEYLDHFIYEEQEQDWRDLLSSGEFTDVLYVAENDNHEIAGYALGRTGPSGVASYDSELVALHVRQADQGQDVGRQLLAAVADRLRRRECSSLMVWVLAQNPARGFYERLGGRLVGEKTTYLGDGDIKAVEVAYGWPAIETLHDRCARDHETPDHD